MKNTKIVATIGPVSKDVDVLKHMMWAGLNVCRLNFSHGDHLWHQETLENIRSAEQEAKKPIAVVADLQGPRIRTVLHEEVDLGVEEEVLLCEKEVLAELEKENEKVIGVDQEDIIRDLEIGQDVLIADGLISLQVIEQGESSCRAKVTNGGKVGNHKGMNMPGATLSIPPLTEKDVSDLEFAVRAGVEYVALSFVGNADHVKDLRKKIEHIEKDERKRPHIIVKIEKQDALDNLDAIIEATDAVMVARGDLATEVGQEKIGVLQKAMIEKCLKKATPVIVATQMLESMIEHPRPTRAEISDVANAVVDHTDATMLSGETANGSYPFESVQTMARIIEKTEESPYDDVLETLETNVDTKYIDMVRGIYELGKHGDAEVLLASTITGETARLLAHFRPQRKILVATDSMQVYRRLSLVWGIEQYFVESVQDEKQMVEMIYEIAKEKEYVANNDEVACIYRDPESGRKKIEMKKVI